MSQILKTLVVVPHLDDETFGMGGTLTELCMHDPNRVKVVALCSGRDVKNRWERLQAFNKVQTELKFKSSIYDYLDMELENVLLKDITKIIETEIDEFQPQCVITVSENDLHQDHKICSHAVRIACRRKVNQLLEFASPLSEPYSRTYFDTEIDVSNYIEIKMHLFGYYKSEHRPPVHSKEYFKTIYRDFIT